MLPKLNFNFFFNKNKNFFIKSDLMLKTLTDNRTNTTIILNNSNKYNNFLDYIN
jgi:hypothetical protein